MKTKKFFIFELSFFITMKRRVRASNKHSSKRGKIHVPPSQPTLTQGGFASTVGSRDAEEENNILKLVNLQEDDHNRREEQTQNDINDYQAGENGSYGSSIGAEESSEEDVQVVTPPSVLVKPGANATSNDVGYGRRVTHNSDKDYMLTLPGHNISVKFPGNKIVCMTNPIITHKEHPHISMTAGKTNSPWFCAECKKPKRTFLNETVIPLKGCYDFYFTSKKYIEKEHKIVMGKLHMWYKKTMELISFFENTGKYDKDCFLLQKQFATELIPNMLLDLDSFKYCAVSCLRKRVIYKVFESCTTAQSAVLLFEMANCNEFDIIARPGRHFDRCDIVTRFDLNFNHDYAFCKDDELRVENLDN